MHSVQDVASTQPFDRMTFSRTILGGRACVRGMRIPGSLMVNLVALCLPTAEILKEYPGLEAEDVRKALEYAATLGSDHYFPLAPTVA